MRYSISPAWLVSILFFVICGQCAASFSINKASVKNSYSCIKASDLKVECVGADNTFTGKLNVLDDEFISSDSKENFEIQLYPFKRKDASIYKVTIKDVSSWCFDFVGGGSSTRTFKDAPFLMADMSSVFLLASPNLRVSTDRLKHSLQICNGYETKVQPSIVGKKEFWLLIGSSKEIVYLAKTPSLWLPVDSLSSKVVDKSSPVVQKESYFFIDLNEGNATKVLGKAKLGQFPYLLVYTDTWAKTAGTYQINSISYPNNINGLTRVSDLAAQHNIKIGLHVMTALVSKFDPLSTPLPDIRLLRLNNVLVEKYGYYLVDVNSSLKNEVSDRIADVMNQIGAEMIYFDGGEALAVSNNASYDIAEIQIEILKRLKKQVLVQGSGNVPRLWPYLSRIAMDDFSSLAPVDYLDFYKISQVLPMLDAAFMPAELGWIGLLSETPSYPATTVEDMSTYMARTLALNIPFSIETREASLDANPYTERLLRMFGVTNHLLQSDWGDVSSRRRLRQGEWYFVDGSRPYFAQFKLQKKHILLGESIVDLAVTSKETNGFMFRLKSIHVDAKNNISLLPNLSANKTIKTQKVDKSNRGILIEKVNLSQGYLRSVNGDYLNLMQGEIKSPVGDGGVNFTKARKMYVEYSTNSLGQNNSDSCSILNLQLEDSKGFFRDYYLDISANRTQSIVINYEDAPARMLKDLPPSYSQYKLKSAVYSFDFSRVVALNLRWMKTCAMNSEVMLKKVEMIPEETATLDGISLFMGNRKLIDIPSLHTQEVLDIFPDGDVTICNIGVCNKIANIFSLVNKSANKPIQIRTKGNAAYDIHLGELTSRVQLEVSD
ncbi:MAG: hypothetical protein Q7S87_02590 [Agitococcus sp.]|nr:hypothetical protein [Agitococcus sp.]